MKQTGEHVLIVDDSEINRRSLTACLEQAGYIVTTVEDGTQAQACLQRMLFDLVLLDIVMPGVSGLELLADLRARFSEHELPIIIVSALDASDDIVRAFELGANDYVTRPFDSRVLLARLARQLSMVSPRQARAYRGSYGLARRNAANNSSTQMPRPLPAQTIAGYTVLRTLGEGATGVVYLAEGQTGDKVDRLALKVLKSMHRDEASRRENLERFLREAETAMRIDHPNAVRILDYGIAEESMVPYIAMEYVEGRPLRDLIVSEHRIPLATKLEMIRQLAALLQVIHAENIIHRDIKSANILVDGRLHVKLSDFGIARLPDSELTITSNLVGTPSYMAPESFTSSQVDGRADIYSLGVVAYELLLGHLPYSSGSLLSLMDDIRTARPPHPLRLDPNFPESLIPVLATMLSKSPDTRFQRAEHLVAALDLAIPSALEDAARLASAGVVAATPLMARFGKSVRPIPPSADWS